MEPRVLTWYQSSDIDPAISRSTMATDSNGNDGGRRKINDISSPYYLSSADFPGMNICGMMLKGESNYREWSTAMKNALRAKRKVGFIDGSIPQPTTNTADSEDWVIVNAMIVGWLMTATDPVLRSNLTYMDSALKNFWEVLKTRFSVADPMRIYELKEAIRQCRQKGQTVTAYFGELKTLWDDYDGLRAIPQCKCNRCTCDLNKQFLRLIEIEKTHEFLLGLDHDGFGVLRSNILSKDDLPSMTKVYQAVTQEERTRNVIKGREERTEVMALAARTGDGRDEKIKCTYCHKTGHDVDNCFKKTGRYPEWWYDNPGRGRGSGRGKERSGPGRGRGKAVAHAAMIGEAYEEKHREGAEQNTVSGLSDEQWKVLLQLVEKSKATSSGDKLSGPTFEDADWSG
ncbi:unnamed protein product [Cuscuta epithymum]|uniref:Retrotransposon Copia-like N-terminal domain-containing protein n=1 Tax=Cuscuta epithymum TaxID=186058 RepID=A0AAV0FCF0_9ASTE|nr:unnamed protein product [Cuscuta epithymum]CAH9133096.1 unnamed protein product [Cuscuta epithymum]